MVRRAQKDKPYTCIDKKLTFPKTILVGGIVEFNPAKQLFLLFPFVSAFVLMELL